MFLLLPDAASANPPAERIRRDNEDEADDAGKQINRRGITVVALR